MAERFIPEHRRTQFKAKNTFKPDELRRRREEQQVEIRKAKREENLAKRRGIAGRDGTQMSAPGASLGASIDSDDEGGTIESQVWDLYVMHAFFLSYFHCYLSHPAASRHLFDAALVKMPYARVFLLNYTRCMAIKPPTPCARKAKSITCRFMVHQANQSLFV